MNACGKRSSLLQYNDNYDRKSSIAQTPGRYFNLSLVFVVKCWSFILIVYSLAPSLLGQGESACNKNTLAYLKKYEWSNNSVFTLSQ